MIGCGQQVAELRFPDREVQLTDTERAVLLRLATGDTVKEAAANLNRSNSSVRRSKDRLMQKFDARTPAHLIAKAFAVGFMGRI